MIELDAEDNKLVVLARGALARTGGVSGAAIRDTDGRTYAAGEVTLDALRLTALQSAVAAAISSGAEGFEAAAVVGGRFSDAGVGAVREVSPAARIVFTDRDGAVFEIVDDSEESDDSTAATAATAEVRGG
ncbi:MULTISPECIES: cytidine/deoxycytidylate deaminase family protein [Nocardia]|uniref:cytidine deaminase n=1 Tax=Nocardia TaxID=1817 RepID=UPI000D686B3F|nr:MULTISPECIES: cytidine deaminase [Nocardia]